MAVERQIQTYLLQFQEKKLAKPRQCSACQKAGCLHWHGSYRRSVITQKQIYFIPVKRLFCSGCRHTFGRLPSFLVKFHRYAKETIHFALRRLKSNTYESVSAWFMEHLERNLAVLTLHFWRRRFA